MLDKTASGALCQVWTTQFCPVPLDKGWPHDIEECDPKRRCRAPTVRRLDSVRPPLPGYCVSCVDAAWLASLLAGDMPWRRSKAGWLHAM
jgi:hypothetical protein